MASTARPGGPSPNFVLTPQQQALLFRALTSNQSQIGLNQNAAPSLSPTSMTQSPPPHGLENRSGAQESPLLEFDYDLGQDTSFDFDFGNGSNETMIGDFPGDEDDKSKDGSNNSSPENDNGDKRSHPDEEEEEDGKDGNGAKRRESEGKVAKKPGRKPLTNEPSSKRKAQNRAAQRAFRERKEQHLKDLETKVEELEKASETTSNENSQLRAQVEKMNMELNEYKKKLSMVNAGPRTFPDRVPSTTFGSGLMSNLGDISFQFEFPKFGVLPGPQSSTNTSSHGITPGMSPSFSSPTNSFSSQPTPSDKSQQASPGSLQSRENSDASPKEALSKFSSIFNVSPYDGTTGNVSRSSLDSTNFSIGGMNSGSPSSSSNSNGGPSSSCGTSPEPYTQSPLGFKPLDTLTTIGEEQPVSASSDSNTHNQLNFDAFDVNNIDWLSQQNGGQFDPQLFGSYREPQDNILANAAIDDSFFNEAFDVDFTTPYNVAPSPKLQKKDLVAEIDARKETEDTISVSANGKLLTCNSIWERLQGCPRVQAGDIDLDGLCSDLQKKAKCGGAGAVVDERDFKEVMVKHLGQGCPDEHSTS